MLTIWTKAFRNAWLAADAEGKEGSRVRAGLEETLPLPLLAYSEWLDSQGVIVGDDEGDDRTHEQLVLDFLALTADA